MKWTDLLLPLTPLYAGAVRARAGAYRRGLLPSSGFPVPVVSVGNLTFGGTGKTPTVAALVRDLVRRGRHPAVLTRGYRRRGADPLVLVGPEVDHEAGKAGDEPVELARRLPGVPVVVDANRARGGSLALRCGADVLLLDDGFQHLRVARDLDLVLVDAGDPWGGGALPPRGRLREPLSAVARASAVLVTKLPMDHEGAFAVIRDRVAGLAPAVPVYGSRMVVRGVRTPEGGRPPAALGGRRVLAFAGLGRPEGFRDLLVEAGAEVVATRWFRDHHRYGDRDLAEVLAAASARRAVAVTTAKDAVKVPVAAGVWVVDAEVAPLSGTWDQLWSLRPGLAEGSWAQARRP